MKKKIGDSPSQVKSRCGALKKKRGHNYICLRPKGHVAREGKRNAIHYFTEVFY